jgi:ABC-type sugar transport system ATPase subunit
MLDVALETVSFRYPKSGFELRDVRITCARSTHTAIVGPPACGASTVLRLLAGELRPSQGSIRIGARLVTTMSARQRPLLFMSGELDVSRRWSVQHALVAALQHRTLDREDRLHEYALALVKWKLGTLTDRRIDTLSRSERALLNLARIELLRPAILVIDRPLEQLSPSIVESVADDFYRTLRVLGTTVISAPSSRLEFGYTDQVIVLDGGSVVQRGVASELFQAPESDAAALATGEVNVVPVDVTGTTVESPIGSWEVAAPRFSGPGVALVRPNAFRLPAAGEDSDLIFGVEEASFAAGVWHLRGILSGGLILRVTLPPGARVHKGRLIALCYDSSAVVLLPREHAPLRTVPTDVVPSMRDSR